MKLFECQNCGQPTYFENTACERCGRRLGFVPAHMLLSALEPGPEPGQFQPLGISAPMMRFCRNADLGVCNWMVPVNGPDDFCPACRHNRMVPDQSIPENQIAWQRIETAKHHLFYSLIKLPLPLTDRRADPKHGLAFDFLADLSDGTGLPGIMTGHTNGLITLNIAEADDAKREERRSQMIEPYRTLLGHFRHEIGHYYWDQLVRDDPVTLNSYRTLFGDERADYSAALTRHYENGAPPDWRDGYVSTYATAHPWEDFAETWAHYLHIVDTLETARSFGIRIRPRVREGASMTVEVDFDPYTATAIEDIVDAWLPMTFAVNSLNRSMGQPDLYPFVLAPAVIEKLAWTHRLIHSRQIAAPPRIA